MIEKHSHVLAYDPVHGQQVFVLPVGDLFEKTAALTKEAQVSEEIARAVESIAPEPGHRYVLVNAMGAGEYYGSNKNADFFNEAGLKHGGEDYGYRTFETARVNVHHDNKDPEKSVGTVKCAYYNDRMHRVELILDVDLSKLAKRDPELYEKVAAGEPADVSMGCFLAGTKVLMSSGLWKKIEDVAVGDSVISHMGRSKEVFATPRRDYKGDLFTFDVYGHMEVTSTEAHPFWALKQEDVMRTECVTKRYFKSIDPSKFSWTHAHELRVGDFLAMPVMSEVETPEYATVGLARLLGYYLAEGHTFYGKKRQLWGIQLSGNHKDVMHRELPSICEALGTKNPPTFWTNENNPNAKYASIYDEKLASLCVEHCGRYSDGKKISPSLMRWDPELQKHFLAAYIAGDGWQNQSWQKGSVGISTCNEQLADQIVMMLARCGVVASIQYINHKAGMGKNTRDTKECVIYIGKNQVNKLAHFSGSIEPVRAQKAGGRKRLIDGYVIMPVRGIEKKPYDGPVFNLEVRDDNSYVAEGIAVHNSKCDRDFCSICGNPAENRTTYCDHLKKLANMIMADGRKVYAYTPHPKFFDISFVTKGADQTAKALQYIQKAASDRVASPSASLEKAAACPEPALHKVAAVKASYEVPVFPGDHREVVLRLEATEPVLEPERLDRLAKIGFAGALSTASHLGIVLRPEEYQYLTLSCLGQQKLAAELWNRGEVFEYDSDLWFSPEIQPIEAQTSPGNLNLKAAGFVADLVPGRSLFEPYFSERAKKASLVPSGTIQKLAEARMTNASYPQGVLTPEFAAALALGYIIYRKGIPTVDVEAIRRAVTDPGIAKKVMLVLLPLVAGAKAVDKMLFMDPPTGSKTAGVGVEVLLPVAGTYLYSAHARKKAMRGERISGLEHMAIDYPLPIAGGAVLAGQLLKRRLGRTMGKSSGMISRVIDKKADIATNMALVLGSGIYRPRLSGALGYLTDLAIGTALGKAVSSAVKSVSEKSSSQSA